MGGFGGPVVLIPGILVQNNKKITLKQTNARFQTFHFNLWIKSCFAPVLFQQLRLDWLQLLLKDPGGGPAWCFSFFENYTTWVST